MGPPSTLRRPLCQFGGHADVDEEVFPFFQPVDFSLETWSEDGSSVSSPLTSRLLLLAVRLGVI